MPHQSDATDRKFHETSFGENYSMDVLVEVSSENVATSVALAPIAQQ